MRKWIGVVCVCLGIVCLLSAIGFVAYNRWENQNAEKMAGTLLEDVQSQTDENIPATVGGEMPTVKVGDYDSIGILSIPVLDVELPVLTDWNYAKLKKAPCLYYGSYYEKNFVIAAHNYPAHFGRLSELQAGDLVVFTDVSGKSRAYEVVLVETLPPNATEEMITAGFDLSLYTCTRGGGSRVTVRCNLVDTANGASQ
ncbi:MAG: sortase [Clostridia bacterium]|nr:sortase [Clostridia bacterium]